MSWLTEPCGPIENTTHEKVTRVELIDHRPPSGKPGRVFTAMNVGTVITSIQDDGRTLKVFLS